MIAAVSAVSAVFRRSSANGKGDRENDRKEGFHGTNVFVLTGRVRLPETLSSSLPSSRYATSALLRPGRTVSQGGKN